jgi:integrase
MASVHKHSSSRSPYYFASFLGEDGRWKFRSTKKCKFSEAMEIAIEYERAARAARAGTLTVAQCRKVLSDMMQRTTGDAVEHKTVEGFFKDWLDHKETTKSERTAERYTTTLNMFKKHLGPKAKLSVAAVTTQDVQSFLNARRKAGIAPKTVSVDRKSLSSVFGSALRQGLILLNPVLATEIAKPVSAERETFTPEQVGIILATLDKPESRKKLRIPANEAGDWRTAIMIGFYTSARLGDCVTMQWPNVDFDRAVMQYEQSKTGAQVVVPMHPDLEKYLLRLADSDTPQTFLCPALAEKNSGGAHGLSQTFKGIMCEAGIDPGTGKGMGSRLFSKLSFHSLRHAFNSALANAGVSQELRMKLTGHKTAAVNTRYTQHELQKLRDAVAKLPSVSAK